MNHDIEALIRAAAARHQLPIALVRAIVRVESSADPHAMRYEPAFYRRYVQHCQHRVWPGVSRDTEEQLRAFSFGLMQIMGQTAREAGYAEKFLTGLLDPATNFDWGCRYLAALQKRYHGNAEAATAAYNAGSAFRAADDRWRNQEYVDKVRRAGGL